MKITPGKITPGKITPGKITPGKITLGLAMAVVIAGGNDPAFAADSSPLSLGQITGMEKLPIRGMTAVTASGLPHVMFMSANGRFVIRGDLYDLWNGRALNSLDDIRAAANTITRMPADIHDLGPLTYGHGPREVTLFVDPQCPACKQVMSQLPALSDKYTFQLMVVPVLGEKSQQLTRSLSCAADGARAVAALLDEDYTKPLEQQPNCDLLPLQKRLVTAQLIGIQGVPFLIGPQGRVSQGAPESLADWLAGGE